MKRALVLVGILFALCTSFTVVYAETPAERRARLEAELQNIEADIAASRGNLQQKQSERKSLERDISIIDSEIQAARLSIKARDINIATLGGDISDKNSDIIKLSERLREDRQSLSELLRRRRVFDEVSVVEVAFQSGSISNFFSDAERYESLKRALKDSYEQITVSHKAVSEAKAVLEEKKDDEVTLRQAQINEKRVIEAREKERKKLLEVTKGEEKIYQEQITVKERSAAEVRAQLFDLRDTTAISFGTALAYAEAASRVTGVRAAVILGVLKQETDLGQNLGTGSYLTDMHPTRDVPVYLAITRTLGLDPAAMRVSKQPGYGWGGAMGPGQFIPSTWACYGGFINTTTGKCGKGSDGTYAGPWVYQESRDIVRSKLGKNSPSDPWSNADAFMATALLMAENGADAGTRAAERLAALRYFAGYANAGKSAYAFYGNGVMSHADYFQSQIDLLK